MSVSDSIAAAVLNHAVAVWLQSSSSQKAIFLAGIWYQSLFFTSCSSIYRSDAILHSSLIWSQ